MKGRRLLLLCLLLMTVAGAHFYTTGATPRFNRYQHQIDQALAQDPRNRPVQISVRRRGGALGFDLVKVAALQGETFERVYLASRGSDKFVIDGSYFQLLGREYGSQNPIYTIRTFPEHVMNLGGGQAFPSWEGGVLGVAGKQMEDFNSLCHRWFMTD